MWPNDDIRVQDRPFGGGGNGLEPLGERMAPHLQPFGAPAAEPVMPGGGGPGWGSPVRHWGRRPDGEARAQAWLDRMDQRLASQRAQQWAAQRLAEQQARRAAVAAWLAQLRPIAAVPPLP